MNSLLWLIFASQAAEGVKFTLGLLGFLFFLLGTAVAVSVAARGSRKSLRPTASEISPR